MSDRSGPIAAPTPLARWHDAHFPSPKKKREPAAASPDTGPVASDGPLSERTNAATLELCSVSAGNGGMPDEVPLRMML